LTLLILTGDLALMQSLAAVNRFARFTRSFIPRRLTSHHLSLRPCPIFTSRPALRIVSCSTLHFHFDTSFHWPFSKQFSTVWLFCQPGPCARSMIEKGHSGSLVSAE